MTTSLASNNFGGLLKLDSAEFSVKNVGGIFSFEELTALLSSTACLKNEENLNISNYYKIMYNNFTRKSKIFIPNKRN